MFGFFSLPTSAFTATPTDWFHAVKQEVNVNDNNKAPAPSRFSLAHIAACVAFDVFIGYRAVTNYSADLSMTFSFF